MHTTSFARIPYVACMRIRRIVPYPSVAFKTLEGETLWEMTMTDEPMTMTVTEAARRLGISRGLAYEAVHRGEIPSISVGNRLLVPRVALERMLEGQGSKDDAS